MEFRRMMLGQLLVISLALNIGILYKYYCIGKQYCKPHKFFPFRNASLMTKREDAYIDLSFFGETCRESSCSTSTSKVSDEVIHLDYGDPTMYGQYWQQLGEKTTVVIPGWKSMSYFSDARDLYWFLEPKFADAVIRLHKFVGNAVTKDRYIVVGTGSTQLFQAALYALSRPNASEPIDVISAAPFYSGYPVVTDFLKSGLYKWAGDAHKYSSDKQYIEVVTSPSNPDGFIRDAVVNQNDKGTLVHDLAYYWPQYTPISSPADHDIMLFTVSKCTGHAGTRIGWALVKNREIAMKMTEFMQLSTIGVSKESQLRASKVLNVVVDTHEHRGMLTGGAHPFFQNSFNLMAKRWKKLRDVIEKSKLFKLPDYSAGNCTFTGRAFAPQPAFAWVECKGEVDDCESFLRSHKIKTRSGKHFGVSTKYTRICVVPGDEEFDQLIQRLSRMG